MKIENNSAPEKAYLEFEICQRGIFKSYSKPQQQSITTLPVKAGEKNNCIAVVINSAFITWVILSHKYK